MVNADQLFYKSLAVSFVSCPVNTAAYVFKFFFRQSFATRHYVKRRGRSAFAEGRLNVVERVQHKSVPLVKGYSAHGDVVFWALDFEHDLPAAAA